MVQFPGIYVIVRKQDPTGGTVGTTMNHFGFYVKDFKESVARWQAAGLPWEPGDYEPLGRTGVHDRTGRRPRRDRDEDKTIGPSMQMHHIHLIVPEPPAAQAWYVQHFGAVPGKRLGGVEAVRKQFDTANVPGAEITLSKANAPTVPTTDAPSITSASKFATSTQSSRSCRLPASNRRPRAQQHERLRSAHRLPHGPVGDRDRAHTGPGCDAACQVRTPQRRRV